MIWLVSSKNGTGNNGTNGKVGKISNFQYWGLGKFNISVPFLPNFSISAIITVYVLYYRQF